MKSEIGRGRGARRRKEREREDVWVREILIFCLCLFFIDRSHGMAVILGVHFKTARLNKGPDMFVQCTHVIYSRIVSQTLTDTL